MRKHIRLNGQLYSNRADKLCETPGVFLGRIGRPLNLLAMTWQTVIQNIDGRLRRLPVSANFVIGLILLIPIWRLDHLTGTQVSMSVFYLLPISYVAWFCSSPYGYTTSAIAAAAWLEADLALGHQYSYWLIPYWNAFVRLTFFIIVASLTGVTIRLRKLNDLERAARQQADDASKLKSNMLSFVSHEIGNSLTVLKMTVFHLEETEGDSVPEDRASCYEMSKRVVTQLTNAVSNFLNANRLETGRFKPNICRTMIRSLVKETITVMKPIIDQKGVHLELDFPTHPVPVRADPDALALVMSNLIGNAFKYTPKGGKVTVRIAPTDGPTPKVLVSVEDTGIGISPEDKRSLFAGFFRTEPGKEVAKGFGVGLKVAHDLLESQGSHLDLESVPGKGSRFFFHLAPWVEEASSSPVVSGT